MTLTGVDGGSLLFMITASGFAGDENGDDGEAGHAPVDNVAAWLGEERVRNLRCKSRHQHTKNQHKDMILTSTNLLIREGTAHM